MESPNSGDVYVRSNGNPAPPIQLIPAGVRRPLGRHLALPEAADASRAFPAWRSSTPSSRSIAATRDSARPRSASTSARAPRTSAFATMSTVLFTALPARRITLRVKDEKGQPAMASFVIRDRLERIYPQPCQAPRARLLLPAADLSRRRRIGPACPTATTRSSTRGGPEYLTRTRELAADSERTVSFKLERWIDPAQVRLVFRRPSRPRSRLLPLQNPTEGVQPAGHDAPDSGRAPEHRERADVGPRLLLPEAVLLRRKIIRSRSPTS